jgi:putative DNA primase/helicase
LSEPGDFFPDGKFDEYKLAKYLTKNKPESSFGCFAVPITPNANGVMFHYDPIEGIWRPDGKAVLGKLMEETIGKKLKARYFNNVYQIVKMRSYIDLEKFKTKKHLLAVNNGFRGTLNLERGELEENSPYHYLMSKIPVKYDPKLKCPLIDKFLKEVYPENPDILYEIAGYCLWKDYPLHKWFILVGEGKNGKSTYLNLVKALLGKENVSEVELQDFDKNRFASAQLLGKLANICADISERGMKNTGRLKMLTGGDRVFAEFKGKDGFSLDNHAKMLYSCNQLPATADDTIAFHRRAVILEFKQVFTEGKNADPDLLKKLTAPEELSGFLNKCVKALKNVLDNHEFTGLKPAEERMDYYTRLSDPAKYFLQKFVVEADDMEDYILKSELYDEYANWCRTICEILPIPSNIFSQKVKQYVGFAMERRPRIDGRQERVWYNVKVEYPGHEPIRKHIEENFPDKEEVEGQIIRNLDLETLLRPRNGERPVTISRYMKKKETVDPEEAPMEILTN